MRKFSKALLLAAVTLCMACGFAACNLGGAPSEPNLPNNSTESPQKTFVVSPKNTSLVIGEEKKITVEYQNQAGVTMQFVSKNPEIATVTSAGVITAVNVGETTIDVTYGEEKETVAVTVNSGGFLPQLNLFEVESSNIQMDVKDRLNLDANVLFNGKQYEDVELTYTVADPTVATVTDGMLQPLKVGTTTVTVVAEWRNFTNTELRKTIALEIIENHIVVINNSESLITIYTSSPNGEVTEGTITATVDGEANDSVVLSIASGSEYITLSENNTITAKKAGNAVIRATYTSNGKEFIDEIDVKAVRPTATYENTIKYFSVKDGDSFEEGATQFTQILATQFGDETITDATQTVMVEGVPTEVPLTIGENNVLKDVQADIVKDENGYTTGINPVTITVNSEKRGIVFTVEAYSLVINEASDLAFFNLKLEAIVASESAPATDKTGTEITSPMIYVTNSVPFDGYYILSKNIDASNYEHAYHGYNTGSMSFQGATVWVYDAETNTQKHYDASEKYGLIGTFDGNGYTIDGLTNKNGGGFFGLIGYKGIVKNVAFTNMKFGSNWATAGLSGRISDGAKLQNIYMHATTIAAGSLFARSICSGAIMENCVIELDGKTGGSGSLFAEDQAKADVATWKNNYVISPVKLYESSSKTVDASNQTITGTGYTLSGFKRYDTSASMIEDKANNETWLATFDSKLWDTATGVPVWKTATK